MRHHLGVGVAGEAAAGGLQLRAELGEVLDDAVVHDGDPARGVGVGVALGRRAVGGPAGVADAGRARERMCGQLGLQIHQLARRAPTVQPPVVQHRDSGRVVAPVLESTQAIDEATGDGRAPHDTDDAATCACRPSLKEVDRAASSTPSATAA